MEHYVICHNCQFSYWKNGIIFGKLIPIKLSILKISSRYHISSEIPWTDLLTWIYLREGNKKTHKSSSRNVNKFIEVFLVKFYVSLLGFYTFRENFAYFVPFSLVGYLWAWFKERKKTLQFLSAGNLFKHN